MAYRLRFGRSRRNFVVDGEMNERCGDRTSEQVEQMMLSADRNVTHELNNQLEVIVSFAELLLEELDAGSRHRGEIEAIDRAVRRLIALLRVVPVSGAAADDLCIGCSRHLAIIVRACDSVLSRVPPTDPLAADVGEMLKAARAVETITASSPRPQLL